MAEANQTDPKKYVVTNTTEKDVKRAGITFKPGDSKPMPLSAAKLAQIDGQPALDVSEVTEIAANQPSKRLARKTASDAKE